MLANEHSRLTLIRRDSPDLQDLYSLPQSNKLFLQVNQERLRGMQSPNPRVRASRLFSASGAGAAMAVAARRRAMGANFMMKILIWSEDFGCCDCYCLYGGDVCWRLTFIRGGHCYPLYLSLSPFSKASCPIQCLAASPPKS